MAKVLSKSEIKDVLLRISTGRNSKRNTLMFLLTLHGLRACEIADLELNSVLDGSGNVADTITITRQATKGGYGARLVYVNADLKQAMVEYLKVRCHSGSRFLITSERSQKFSANGVAVFFYRLYKRLGLLGVSSHSGRKSFITYSARKISQVGGTIRDIQALVGHRWLSSTQRYIEQDVEAQKKIINAIY